ncbi:MAG: hypothetical protein ACSHXG_15365 [Maribacter stanieri]
MKLVGDLSHWCVTSESMLQDQEHIRWQQVINEHQNMEELTITPEFGPYPYMPQTPFNQMPLANQQELNIEMRDYLKRKITIY